MTGEPGQHVQWPLFGRRRSQGWSRLAATTAKASSVTKCRPMPDRNIAVGISGISKPNEVRPAWKRTGARFVVCYGRSGLPTGSLPKRCLLRRLAASIIRILSRSLSIRIAIATGQRLVIRAWRQLSDSLLGNQGLTCRPLCCTVNAMGCIHPGCQKVKKSSFPHSMNDGSFLLRDISFRARPPTLSSRPFGNWLSISGPKYESVWGTGVGTRPKALLTLKTLHPSLCKWRRVASRYLNALTRSANNTVPNRYEKSYSLFWRFEHLGLQPRKRDAVWFGDSLARSSANRAWYWLHDSRGRLKRTDDGVRRSR